MRFKERRTRDTPGKESEALNALNVKMRRKGKAVQLMEATIESDAKARAARSQGQPSYRKT